jgi:hypothetical protein
MFISWGRATVVRAFGAPVEQYCPICEKERTFRQTLSYKVRHILWIFRWVSGKKYALVCDVCRRGQTLKAAEVESLQRKSIIPFIDRFGWAVGLVILAALVGWGSWVNQENYKRDLAYLAAPAVDDIYEIDLAKMSRPPKTDLEYSLMKVTGVSGSFLQVRLSRIYCNKYGCASTDVTNGKAKADDYYGEKVYAVPRAELIKMREDGRITAVDR